MKLLRAICVLGLTLGLVTSVYAGTQSVKLSGDLAVRGLYRDQYTLASREEGWTTRTGTDRNQQQWMMSTVETQIDADLTDNVSAVVRLVNQRDWNTYTKNITIGTTAISAVATPNGRGGYTENDSAFDIIVDLAYLELKEFLYSPLTLKIGRQDLWFRRGFIVGANQQNPDLTLSAPEYTAINSFDSIRGTLDYDPWTVDLVYANIYGNTIQSDDGIDLYGTNIGYIFDSYNAESEAYYWFKRDRQIEALYKAQNNDVHCLGLRGSADPIDNWTIALEGAFQFGQTESSAIQTEGRDRRAWGLNTSVECRQFTNQYAWKPVLTLEYVYYSGDRHAADLDDEVGVTDVDADEPGVYEQRGRARHQGTTLGTNTGWDPMFRGKFDSAYREFIGRFYATGAFPLRPHLYQSYADASFTNQHQAFISGTVMPTDSLTCTGRFSLFWLDEDISTIRTDEYIGSELDINLEWDYTEDVSFGLLGAWFNPGDLYPDDENVATDIVGTVKLSF
jgi:hypothetical protein